MAESDAQSSTGCGCAALVGTAISVAASGALSNWVNELQHPYKTSVLLAVSGLVLGGIAIGYARSTRRYNDSRAVLGTVVDLTAKPIRGIKSNDKHMISVVVKYQDPTSGETLETEEHHQSRLEDVKVDVGSTRQLAISNADSKLVWFTDNGSNGSGDRHQLLSILCLIGCVVLLVLAILELI